MLCCYRKIINTGWCDEAELPLSPPMLIIFLKLAHSKAFYSFYTTAIYQLKQILKNIHFVVFFFIRLQLHLKVVKQVSSCSPLCYSSYKHSIPHFFFHSLDVNKINLSSVGKLDSVTAFPLTVAKC